ncbi:hypothetical protein HOY80DRAFT_408168 [Tuber brumale]|nr:hypothetical protein HOY80DRAFT_408168 [Tuber brumale]
MALLYLSLEATLARVRGFTVSHRYQYPHRLTRSLRSPLRSHSLTRSIIPFYSSHLCSRRAPLYSRCIHCTSRPHAPASSQQRRRSFPPSFACSPMVAYLPTAFFDIDVDATIPADIDRSY